MPMPRQARKQSETGIYHVMLRGINRQQIFEEGEDFERFLEIIRKCKEIGRFQLYAYCLMGNHVHILLKPEGETLEVIFKRIAGHLCIGITPNTPETGICSKTASKASRWRPRPISLLF